MTDWKKTPSTIVNFALAILTAAAVALASLKGDGIEVPLWVVSAVTAGTVFLRALPPLGGEKKTDERGFVGIKLMLAISALGLLLLVSCRAPLTPADLECLAAVDIVEDIVLAKECAPLSGEAQDACIDRVSDRFDPLAESCGKDGAQ